MTLREWGVVLTDAGLNELGEELKPFLRKGAIGCYMLCKQVDMRQPYLRMVVDDPHPHAAPVEVEISVPHHYVKLIAAGTDRRQMRFLQ